MTMPRTTWDGLPIADDEPHGATIVTLRTDGRLLMLHRNALGPAFEGDWAWTSPAGARQPGEPIVPAARRELAEEAGLEGVRIEAVDLSGHWALFLTRVPDDCAVDLVDIEHDRYEWLTPQEAYARLQPPLVGDAVRRVLATAPGSIDLRPLTRADLPALVTWQHEPHVTAWWQRPVADVAAAEAKYGPRIDGLEPTTVEVIRLDARPIGFIQSTPLVDYADPDFVAAIAPALGGPAGVVCIDYAIGLPELTGRGLGTRAIWAYLDTILHRCPATRYVIADPATANRASVRAGERAGFRSLIEYGDQTVCVLDRARLFG